MVLKMGGNYLDHAGKVMALKAFGQHNDDVVPVDHIDDLKDMWDFKVIESHLSDQQYIMDYLATAHEYTEQIYLKHFREFIKPDDIVGYSGGIAQNTIINKVLKDAIPNLVIPPHANDQGLSIGIIEYLRREYNLDPFEKDGFPFWQDDQTVPRPSTKTIKDTAELLAQGKIVGWYQGHGEIGPRALGNRSILMNPFDPQGKDWINNKVKHREPFRPFGASVLQNKVSQYFYWNGASPYMLYVTDVLEPERFPTITHADGTCRINTVSPEQEDYYMLLQEYEKLTGVPILLNTSLNNGGRPIAGRICDALELYYKTDLDVLVYGDTSMIKIS
jgi:carbamoyltransferase